MHQQPKSRESPMWGGFQCFESAPQKSCSRLDSRRGRAVSRKLDQGQVPREMGVVLGRFGAREVRAHDVVLHRLQL